MCQARRFGSRAAQACPWIWKLQTWMKATLHKVFAVRDQPKANTLLSWAAHPCQEVNNIPHPYPSLPCSALWLLAIMEVWPSKANPAWAFHLQGMQACVLRAALHSISIVSKHSHHCKQVCTINAAKSRPRYTQEAVETCMLSSEICMQPIWAFTLILIQSNCEDEIKYDHIIAAALPSWVM